MFEKSKEFYKKHREVIITVIGGAVVVTTGVLLGKKISNNMTDKAISKGLTNECDDSATRELLESFGAVYRDESKVPFATKEVATKFMEEMGDTYQIDILEPNTSAIWISKNNG